MQHDNITGNADKLTFWMKNVQMNWVYDMTSSFMKSAIRMLSAVSEIRH